MPWNTQAEPDRHRPAELVRKHWWSLRKTRATTVHDVWVQSKLAATHAAAGASATATLETSTRILTDQLAELLARVDRLGEATDKMADRVNKVEKAVTVALTRPKARRVTNEGPAYNHD